MKVENLKIGDSFTYKPHLSIATVKALLEDECVMCRSNVSENFIVNNDYEIFDFYAAELTVKEVAQIVLNYSKEKFAEFENYLNGIEVPDPLPHEVPPAEETPTEETPAE